MSAPDRRPTLRILLLIDDLRLGGAQRVMSTLAKHWAVEGHRVDLVTLDDPREDFYLVDGVQRVGLGLAQPTGSTARALRINAQRIMRIRRAVASARPDVVISFMERMNVRALVATAGLPVPVVVSERIDPRLHRVHPLLRPIRRLTYLRASSVVVQTQAIRDWAASWGRRGRISVVPNPVPPEFGARPPRRAKGREVVIAGIGRLSPQKQFHLLIEAFAALAPSAPTARLVIYGEGPERGRLEQLALQLGVSERVDLPGAGVITPDVLESIDIFVLSSKYEGFPNVLLETLAVGVPAVTFAGLQGGDEMVDDRVNGLVVAPNDVAALSRSILELVQNEALRAELGANAPGLMQRFSLGAVGAQWDGILQDVIGPRRHDL